MAATARHVARVVRTSHYGHLRARIRRGGGERHAMGHVAHGAWPDYSVCEFEREPPPPALLATACQAMDPSAEADVPIGDRKSVV